MSRIIFENAKITSLMAGHGFKCETTEAKADGAMRTEKFTVWTQEQFVVGQIVNVEGFHSVKVEQFTPEGEAEVVYARAHVNKATIKVSDGGKVKEAAIMDQWPGSAMSDEEPF